MMSPRACCWVLLGCVAPGCRGDDAASGGSSSDAADTSSGSASDAPAPDTGSESGHGDRGTSSATEVGSDATTDDVDVSSSSSGGVDIVGPRYDEVQQKSAHNAYQRQEALLDQLVYHRIRSLELDIHVGKSLQPTQDGEWYVYHTDIVDDGTSCVHLGDCLAQVAAFDDVLAQHEVVTLWIDLKDDWDGTHGPAELDARLHAALGDALLTPADLLARCPGARDVQRALQGDACGWPELEAMRGRVLVVLTGGASTLRTYHDDDGRSRAAFVAPAITQAADAVQWPNTPVFNFAAADVSLAGEVASAGHVVRVWGNNDEGAWQAAVDVDAHHVATDKVSQSQDPWASTADAQGWPFRCIGECAPFGPEPGAVLGIEVESGDIWDIADSAWFVHDMLGDEADHAWQAMVATANSHVEPFAKGCLMARAQLDADAPYFAVCRPADEEPLRVQWRASAGETSIAIENDIAAPDTIAPSSVAFVRLRVSGGGVCVAGDGSRDGIDWVEIGSHCFDEPLPLQGITGSSHDGGVVRLLFVELQRDDEVRVLGDFAASSAIADAGATVFDGVVP